MATATARPPIIRADPPWAYPKAQRRREARHRRSTWHLLRELAAEFGFYPASVKDIERTRAQLAEHDRWRARAEASSLTRGQLAHRYAHLSRLVKNERESNGRKHLGQ